MTTTFRSLLLCLLTLSGTSGQLPISSLRSENTTYADLKDDGESAASLTILEKGPTLARQMYADKCLGEKRNTSNQCMCDFLQSVRRAIPGATSVRGEAVDCVDNVIDAGGFQYTCQNSRLMSMVSIAELVGDDGDTEEGNDCWGWTSAGGDEIAILGMQSFVAFVDITDPVNPTFLGRLPSRGEPTFWKDIKTYDNYAYIVAENEGNGLQVIEMTQMLNLDLSNGPVSFGESAFLDDFSTAHNIFINEETAFAYIVGSNICSKGLVIMDLSNPGAPEFEACFGDDGYVHDVQCVIYTGNDSRYVGREICFACNEDTVTIIDVHDKSDMNILSRTIYTDVGYTHQGWLSEDHNTFFFGDETDEVDYGFNTRTMVMNVQNLEDPVVVGTFFGESAALDHNMYVKDGFLYESNYAEGLQVFEIGDSISTSVDVARVAVFDSYPESRGLFYSGAWSSYIYFPSGNIVIGDVNRGLITVQVDPEGSDGSPYEGLCPAEQTCNKIVSGKSGFSMHREFLFGLFCLPLCVSEDMVETRNRRGWVCGRCA